MNLRLPSTMGALVPTLSVLLLVQAPVAAQSQGVAAENWTPPRTLWGAPDLEGVWTNETITPFERPNQFADKAFLSEEEVAELEEQTARRRAASDGTSNPGSVGSYNQFWFDSGTEVLSTRQTSLVVDPPDGKVPVRPAAEKKRDYNRAHSTDSYEYMSVWDRCITRGVPGSMFPAGYNNAYQIVQVPGLVVILYEMIHDARIIPLDRPPPRVPEHPSVDGGFAWPLGG